MKYANYIAIFILAAIIVLLLFRSKNAAHIIDANQQQIKKYQLLADSLIKSEAKKQEQLRLSLLRQEALTARIAITDSVVIVLRKKIKPYAKPDYSAVHYDSLGSLFAERAARYRARATQ